MFKRFETCSPIQPFFLKRRGRGMEDAHQTRERGGNLAYLAMVWTKTLCELLCIVTLATGRGGHGFETCRGLKFLFDSPLHNMQKCHLSWQLGGTLPIYTSWAPWYRHCWSEGIALKGSKSTTPRSSLRWFLSIAWRIPTVHKFCAINAPKWAHERAQHKKCPSS